MCSIDLDVGDVQLFRLLARAPHAAHAAHLQRLRSLMDRRNAYRLRNEQLLKASTSRRRRRRRRHNNLFRDDSRETRTPRSRRSSSPRRGTFLACPPPARACFFDVVIVVARHRSELALYSRIHRRLIGSVQRDEDRRRRGPSISGSRPPHSAHSALPPLSRGAALR